MNPAWWALGAWAAGTALACVVGYVIDKRAGRYDPERHR